MKKFLIVTLLTLVLLGLFATTANAEWMVTTGNANIRQYPGLMTRSIGVLDQGEWVYVLNHIYTVDGREWCQIRWKEQDGYVSSVNLAAEEPKEERVSYTNETIFPFVTLAEVNVRQWPDIEAAVLGVYPNRTTVYGSRFYPCENGDLWLEVIIGEKENGEREYGYIHVHNLQLLREDCNFQNLQQLYYCMRISGDSVNVRADCDVKAESVKVLVKGKYVSPIIFVCTDDGQTARIWAYCYRDEKPLGWISCLYLEK